MKRIEAGRYTETLPDGRQIDLVRLTTNSHEYPKWDLMVDGEGVAKLDRKKDATSIIENLDVYLFGKYLSNIAHNQGRAASYEGWYGTMERREHFERRSNILSVVSEAMMGMRLSKQALDIWNNDALRSIEENQVRKQERIDANARR